MEQSDLISIVVIIVTMLIALSILRKYNRKTQLKTRLELAGLKVIRVWEVSSGINTKATMLKCIQYTNKRNCSNDEDIDLENCRKNALIYRDILDGVSKQTGLGKLDISREVIRLLKS